MIRAVFLRAVLLRAYDVLYAGLLRPLIFRGPAMKAHARLLRWLRWADGQRWLLALLGIIHRAAFRPQPVTVGGVTLPSPLILAAGLVKGDGFDSEAAALQAAADGLNIMPGWRCLPCLVGPVEFGSFTRWPRLGNSGTVVWRDTATRTTQNRIGLRNPGALAAAVFLADRRDDLPALFGINIAVSPGVEALDQQEVEIRESLAVFLERGVVPAWFTLNLSCPNTEDDPHGYQTGEQAARLCGAAVRYLGMMADRVGRAVPLWVKLGPELAAEQYRGLARVLADVGVAAVIATNTLPLPTPDDPAVQAGAGGGKLHATAVNAAALLAGEIRARGCRLDVVGCGGVLDGATCFDFRAAGAIAFQYWTALVYRGPLAAAVILDEKGAMTHDSAG